MSRRAEPSIPSFSEGARAVRGEGGTFTPPARRVAVPDRRPGSPLDGPARGQMEGALGFDFSRVRIHEEGAPEASAAPAGALAWTLGEEVHFAPGRYQPGTPAGDALLGHELAHVMQQHAGRAAGPQAKGPPGAGGSGLEAEAERLGMQAAKTPKGAAAAKPTPAAPAKADPPLGGRQVGQLAEKQRKSLQEVTGVGLIAVPADKAVKNTMLAPEFQPGIPWSFRVPLTNVLDDLSRGALKANTTAAVELDLSGFGGVKTVWRFTRLATDAGTRYLVDLVTNQGPATPDGGKFKAHKFKVTGNADFQSVVQQAVARIPDAFLAQIDGVSFQRAATNQKDPKEAGNYDVDAHAVTIFDVGMKPGASRFDDNAGYEAPVDDRVRRVIHEIGHAIDQMALRTAIVGKQAARKHLEDNWSGNVKFVDDGVLEWSADQMPLDELANLKAGATKYDKAHKAVKAARAETGHGAGGTTPTIATPFKAALDADGTRPLTPYVAEKREAWEKELDATKKLAKQAEFLTEAYAEAFSLYIAEPETLRLLRPKTYAFFKDKQEKLEKKAAAKKP